MVTATGALRIETETEEYSADIYLGNTDDRKADRERKTIGVGERITLTLTGKPLGNVDELEWNLVEDGDKYVEMPEETKGKISIVVTAKKRLQREQRERFCHDLRSVQHFLRHAGEKFC